MRDLTKNGGSELCNNIYTLLNRRCADRQTYRSCSDAGIELGISSSSSAPVANIREYMIYMTCTNGLLTTFVDLQPESSRDYATRQITEKKKVKISRLGRMLAKRVGGMRNRMTSFRPSLEMDFVSGPAVHSTCVIWPRKSLQSADQPTAIHEVILALI
jgi:hypothetical protein